MVPAVGSGLTVIETLSTLLPQVAVETVYLIITVPAELPVTIPVDAPTVAAVPTLDQVPPEVAPESVIVELTQTLVGPVIAALPGSA